MVGATHAGESYVTPALDLSRVLKTLLPQEHGRRVVSLMKLDVELEGGEFTLLPWLLLHGSICRLRHLHVEWHLNRLSPEERLAALGLRLSLHTLLEHGCDVPPRTCLHLPRYRYAE